VVRDAQDAEVSGPPDRQSDLEHEIVRIGGFTDFRSGLAAHVEGLRRAVAEQRAGAPPTMKERGDRRLQARAQTVVGGLVDRPARPLGDRGDEMADDPLAVQGAQVRTACARPRPAAPVPATCAGS
jgi:hypothetical protein